MNTLTRPQVKSSVTLNRLYDLINEAKKSSCYQVANLAFAVLLHKAIDDPTIKIIWESSSDWSTSAYSEVENNSYYDLVVVKWESNDSCIPVPLLKQWVQKACFQEAKHSQKFIEKRVHNRKLFPCLPKQKEYLLKKLENLAPNYMLLAAKYLNEN